MRMAIVCALLISVPIFAQFSIEPVAGGPRALGDNGPATSALLWSPQGVSVDAAGNLYIADTGNGRIRKVTPAGTITTIAGTVPGDFGDNGPATSAQLSFPAKALVAANGDIYIVDSGNKRVRRVTSNGVISTVAGTGQQGFAGEGDLATNARFDNLRDIAQDLNGSLLVLDSNNQRIRRFTAGGRISTIAGSGVYGFFGDQGRADQAQLASPWGIAVDRTGVVYIGDTQNNRVRKISTDGVISTVAGLNGAGFAGDAGQASFARLNRPTGVAVDGSGNLYVADTGNHRVRKIDTRSIITTIAGGVGPGFAGDNGPATSALLNMPESLAIDAGGNIFVADTGNHRIRKISPQGIITTVAGSDTGSGDNGLAVNARLFQPSGVVFDGSGNLYLADTLNNRIRRISPDGTIITVAGTGSPGYTGDNGLAVRAQLNNPNSIALDRAGNLYIADTSNNVIRRVVGGTITTVAGTGTPGNEGDGGPATSATLFGPNAVLPDRSGNLYIADSGNNRIRVLNTSGVINPFAGDATGLPGTGGDNGPARNAMFDYPRALAMDNGGNIFIADFFNNRVRRIDVNTSVVTTVAGTGAPIYSGDGGPATQAALHLPSGLAFDTNGNLYIADLLNDRIRVVTNGIIQTVAGSNVSGYAGDFGPALNALLDSPRDIAVDAAGNAYFSDQDNNAVRRLVAQTISVRTVVNAASQVAGSVAPGEAVSIFGSKLGPITGVPAMPSNGNYGSTLGGFRVLFNGVAAPLLFASNGQVNAIVPYEVVGSSSVQIQVSGGGSQSSNFTLPVRDAAPGLFTADSSGQGQLAAVNDNGQLNSSSNPVARGAVISLYATGEGQTVPGGATGRAATGDAGSLPRPVQPVTVLIQGSPAPVLFAGSAPGSIGLMQVNIRIPSDVIPGDRVPVELRVGVFSSQPGVTIAVR